MRERFLKEAHIMETEVINVCVLSVGRPLI
jgi:hypothetical protein